MEIAEKVGIEVSAQYTVDSFRANRQLYNEDEAMCSILENAIWVCVSITCYFCM